MNRLWLRLFVALFAVLLVAVGSAWLLAARSVTDQFANYVEDEQALRAERVQQVFRNYRLQTGSWVGIQALTERVGELAGEHVVVTDADRIVVADSLDYYLDRRADPNWQGIQLPIVDGPRTLGTVYLSPTRPANLADLRQRAFVDARNRSLLVAAVVGLVSAVVLSVFVARRIALPIEAVTAAARAMQHGNLQPALTVDEREPTEVQALGRAFRALARSLERTEQLRRNMVSDIAHELRTPLSNVSGYLEAIQDGMVQPTPEVLEILTSETTSLARLVDDLQELSQAEAGQLRLVRELVPVHDLVAATVQALEAYPDAADRTLTVDVSPADLQVYADPVRSRQVLRNLLTNAIRYTRPGGQIRVTAQADQSGQVVISVADNGAGITPEDLPLIFERFYRTSAARDRASGGTGLGLTIARQLARAQAGDLTVLSQPGKGSIFTLSLPASPERARPAAAAAAPAPVHRPAPIVALGALVGTCAGVVAAGVEAIVISLEGSRGAFFEAFPVSLAFDAVGFAAIGTIGGLAVTLFGRDVAGGLPRHIRLALIAVALAAPSVYVASSQVRRLPAAADFATSTVVPDWLPAASLAVGMGGAALTVIGAFLLIRSFWWRPHPASRLVFAIVGGMLLLALLAGLIPFTQFPPAITQAAPPPGGAPGSQVAAQAGRPPNVVLVTFSSLRVDHTSAYGYQRTTTPAIDQLARAGVRFDSAYTPQPHVLTAHASIMTGLLPAEHGIRGFAGDRLSPRATTLAETLSRAGYQTAAFYSSPGTADPMQAVTRGFQRAVPLRSDTTRNGAASGFLANYQRYLYLLALPEQINEILGIENPALRAYGRADVVTNAAIDWLTQRADRPFFLWVHYFDPHTPHNAPDPYSTLFLDSCVQCDIDRTIDRLRNGDPLGEEDRDYLISQYDGEIRFADSQLGRLLAEVDASGARQNTLIVATSSNGLPLGETSRSRRAWLLDAGINVPLVMALPGVITPTTEITQPVETIDIAPTVLDLLGLGRAGGLEGQSLRPLLSPVSTTDRTVFSELPDRSRVAVVTPNWKLLYTPATQFALLLRRGDEREMTNLADEYPEITQELIAQALAELNRQP